MLFKKSLYSFITIHLNLVYLFTALNKNRSKQPMGHMEMNASESCPVDFSPFCCKNGVIYMRLGKGLIDIQK